MTNRIKCIVDKIDPCDIVLDVGCDSAQVSIELAKKGISSYASDIRTNIILDAQKRIDSLGFNDKITLFVSDGLENIQDNLKIDTLVIAGMGTDNIINIMNNSNSRYKKIITISNTKHNQLRKYFNRINYKIKEEEIIYDKKKYYNLIVFVAGKEILSEEDIIVGKNHNNIPLFDKYNLYKLDKLSKLNINALSGDVKKELLVRKRLIK